jgi:hypothetical protein
MLTWLWARICKPMLKSIIRYLAAAVLARSQLEMTFLDDEISQGRRDRTSCNEDGRSKETTL